MKCYKFFLRALMCEWLVSQKLKYYRVVPFQNSEKSPYQPLLLMF